MGCCVHLVTVPMSQIHQQQPRAGTSLTKACIRMGCAALRPVVISHWNKTGAGFPA
jgi:hypothetical protein